MPGGRLGLSRFIGALIREMLDRSRSWRPIAANAMTCGLAPEDNQCDADKGRHEHGREHVEWVRGFRRAVTGVGIDHQRQRPTRNIVPSLANAACLGVISLTDAATDMPLLR